ncbi:MAG: hypothetical protein FWE33_08100 [Defluviitaleaceae bacterium]|nr:hypothetical protein [Defluviitaleaceae bacterium]
MKAKRIVALALLVVMIIGASSSAVMARGFGRMDGNQGFGGCGGGMQGLMWDDNGEFLAREAFETRIDGYIAQGFILQSSRAGLLAHFDWCAENGGGAFGRCVFGNAARGTGCGAWR